MVISVNIVTSNIGVRRHYDGGKMIKDIALIKLSLWIYQVGIVTSNILEHRHYDGDKMINDIALIKLAKPVDISGKHCYIKYTCT